MKSLQTIFSSVKWCLIVFIVTIVLIMTRCSEAQLPSHLTFEISFPRQSHQEPITGRVYAIISKSKEKEPRFQTGYTGVPIWGENVVSLKPGEGGIIDVESFGYPLRSLADIPAGEYYVQGFINIYSEFKRSDGHVIWLHDDQWEGQQWNRSPGNLYSDVKKVFIDPAKGGQIKIQCTRVIPPVKIPPDTKWVKRIKFQSELLSKFWGRPIYLGATVLLPKGYDRQSDVYYPVNYLQGHFSPSVPYGFRTEDPGDGNRRAQAGYDFYQYWMSDACPRMIAVTFQHPCPYFDDSFAVNSANVGPYGDAIMQELIPKVEETFRIIREPYARVLCGGSTGGWEALALQIYNPDYFGATFSFCSDPVDFRYYQIVNIYEDKNAYFTDYEWMRIERPYARRPDGSVSYMMKDRHYYELAIGDKNRSGGQMAIWEAVFTPVGEDGYPQPLWNWISGEIDHEVAELWKPYDLRHYLEKNWSWIGPKLEGKLHIYTGDMDTYYLNNAVVLLEEFLEKTKNPHWGGLIEYGDREPHCWGPRGKQLIELMAKAIEKNALKTK